MLFSREYVRSAKNCRRIPSKSADPQNSDIAVAPLPNSSRRTGASGSGDQPVRSKAASTALSKLCGASLECVTADAISPPSAQAARWTAYGRILRIQARHRATGASTLWSLRAFLLILVLQADSPDSQMSGLFCVTLFRTSGCTPCDACASIPAHFAMDIVCWRKPFLPLPKSCSAERRTESI